MEKKIRKALNDIGIPCYFVTRGNNDVECIVYNYIPFPSYYADNKLKGTKYTILINIYSKEKTEFLKNKVLETMRQNGFKGGSIKATIPVAEQKGQNFYNTAITFNGFIKAE